MFGIVKPQQINEHNRMEILKLIDECRRICGNIELGTALSSARDLVSVSAASDRKTSCRERVWTWV